MENEFRTKDLYEASVLYSLGKKVLRLEGSGNQYWFVFADSDSCKEFSDLYWRGEIEVNAKSLVNCIRDLKDRIFSQGR